MDTKIAAALNNLNLNSQQKKIINEVLDNKFKLIFHLYIPRKSATYKKRTQKESR